MFITGANKSFEVIRTIESHSCYTIYLGKNMTEKEGVQIYEITCYKKGNEMKHLIPIFVAERKNRQFRDYVTCFSKNGEFYVVFRHYDGELLSQQLNDFYYSFREKLTIMKNLYEKILLLNIPDLILYEALQKENLFLKESLEIQWNYKLSNFKSLDGSKDVKADAMNLAHEQFVSVFKEIFSKEMSNKYSEKFEEFYQAIKDDTYVGYREEYRAYMLIYEELEQAAERGELKPNSKKVRAKVWIYDHTPQIKTALMTIVLAAAVLVLMFVPISSKNQKGVKFSYIGTQEIQLDDSTIE